MPDHVAASLLTAHHQFVDVGALELRDEGADRFDSGTGVGGARPHRVSLPRRRGGRLLGPCLGESESAREGGSGLTGSQLHGWGSCVKDRKSTRLNSSQPWI